MGKTSCCYCHSRVKVQFGCPGLANDKFGHSVCRHCVGPVAVDCASNSGVLLYDAAKREFSGLAGELLSPCTRCVMEKEDSIGKHRTKSGNRPKIFKPQDISILREILISQGQWDGLVLWNLLMRQSFSQSYSGSDIARAIQDLRDQAIQEYGPASSGFLPSENSRRYPAKRQRAGSNFDSVLEHSTLHVQDDVDDRQPAAKRPCRVVSDEGYSTSTEQSSVDHVDQFQPNYQPEIPPNTPSVHDVQLAVDPLLELTSGDPVAFHAICQDVLSRFTYNTLFLMIASKLFQSFRAAEDKLKMGLLHSRIDRDEVRKRRFICAVCTEGEHAAVLIVDNRSKQFKAPLALSTRQIGAEFKGAMLDYAKWVWCYANGVWPEWWDTVCFMDNLQVPGYLRVDPRISVFYFLHNLTICESDLATVDELDWRCVRVMFSCTSVADPSSLMCAVVRMLITNQLPQY